MTPILSRDDSVWHQPPGSPRRYLLAPMTRRERNLFRRAMVIEGAVMHSNERILEGLRFAVQELAPANLDEVLALIDEAEAEQKERQADPAGQAGPATARLVPIEAAARAVPAYATLLADRSFFMATYPAVAARFALRGWEGPGLPEFQRRNGEAAADALEAVPDDDLTSLGIEAYRMAFLSQDAEKNCAAPSQSDGTPSSGAT
ncbi:hypothetical protein [Falsiroseomonas tokyonensis]|uniref:Uncharacterized protein n=1 Tax=Falsiroseomonas tokyonensis TaxID=430521 RepID=A0ABV7C3R7_9PROT|nr:hypothetical protein [Falsiroseomonas tokyonensis]MBU8540808.1 hypothetical protein [Falsiroseomonas tokyonensis]